MVSLVNFNFLNKRLKQTIEFKNNTIARYIIDFMTLKYE